MSFTLVGNPVSIAKTQDVQTIEQEETKEVEQNNDEKAKMVEIQNSIIKETENEEETVIVFADLPLDYIIHKGYISREEYFELFGFYPGELGKDWYVEYGPEFQKKGEE